MESEGVVDLKLGHLLHDKEVAKIVRKYAAQAYSKIPAYRQPDYQVRLKDKDGEAVYNHSTKWERTQHYKASEGRVVAFVETCTFPGMGSEKKHHWLQQIIGGY